MVHGVVRRSAEVVHLRLAGDKEDREGMPHDGVVVNHEVVVIRTDGTREGGG